MSIKNPYMKKTPYERIVYTFTDELMTTKRQNKGKWEMVDDSVIDLDECWKNESKQQILVRLFNGSCNEQELVNYYQNGVYKEEKRVAQEQGRHPEDPFPFGELRENFLKTMIRLRVLGLIDQIPGEINSREGSIYSLTDSGYEFIIKNIIDEIGNENFDAFMVLLVSEEKNIVPFSYILMKVIEQRKYPHDQLIMLVDDLNRATGDQLLQEYKEYLRVIEKEDISDIDESTIIGSVLKKISSLIRTGMVETDNNYYVQTERGKEESNRMIKDIKKLLEILNSTGIIEIKSIRNRYYISLTESGKFISERIREHFESDRQRLLDIGSLMNDMDDHEIAGVLPVHQYMERLEEAKKNMQLSIYVFDERQAPLRDRIRLRMTTIVGTAATMFFCMILFGFFLIPVSPDFGIGVLAFSSVSTFMCVCMYQPARSIVHATMNKAEHKFIKEQFQLRQKKRMELLKKQKKAKH